MKRRAIGLVLLVLVMVAPVWAAEAGLKQGDAVAVCGDSITEQKLYSMMIEDYLLMCQPAPQMRTAAFGWGGETAPGFLGRMDNDVIWLAPTVATTCYGMNDGGYRPMQPDTAKRYTDATRAIVQRFKKAGTRLIIVGSPGVVDATTYRNSPEQAAMYNKTLAGLRDIARQVAEEEKVTFANVYDPMMEVMTKAKAKYGAAYHVAGGDGVHPSFNGHLVMAYAFLKAMGCDGNIGTITVDLAAGKAQATEGHKIVSAQGGTVEVESARYPFCFFGKPETTDSTKGVLEFFPFNQDLNRFRLVVNGAKGKVKVTWGAESKEFSAEDLAKGINLAAEFLDNPFCGQFAKVQQAIRAQQDYETFLHKTLLHNNPMYLNMFPEEKDTLQRLATAGIKRQRQLSDAAAAAVTPVRHTIKVEQQQ